MAKFLIRANYVGGGVKGLLSEGGSKPARRCSGGHRIGGGQFGLHVFYAFGDTDVYAICDMPDELRRDGGVVADQRLVVL